MSNESHALQEVSDHVGGARAFVQQTLAFPRARSILEHLDGARIAAARAYSQHRSLTEELHRLNRIVTAQEQTISFLRRALLVSIWRTYIQGAAKSIPYNCQLFGIFCASACIFNAHFHTLVTYIHTRIKLPKGISLSLTRTKLLHFYAPQLYPQVLLRRVLAMGILSVCPSVCPSVTTRWYTKPR